ncbi:MAG: hypothetical protein HUJ51_05410 [Eggerthellaceae bacterium]|nr:hypothetical protein [Eggerthellaceae bacterium]
MCIDDADQLAALQREIVLGLGLVFPTARDFDLRSTLPCCKSSLCHEC